VWAGQLLGAIAIKNIGAVVFSVMQPAQPVLTLIIAVAIGMERLRLCGGCDVSLYVRLFVRSSVRPFVHSLSSSFAHFLLLRQPQMRASPCSHYSLFSLLHVQV
jgi:hypothetical protein